MILNALDGKPLPVYGDGMQIRDWLFVEDHARALYQVVTEGVVGETYNIGATMKKPILKSSKPSAPCWKSLFLKNRPVWHVMKI